MKVIKILFGIMLAVGIVLVIGAVGADDLAVELDQAHSLDWIQIIVGFLMMLPFVIINVRKRHDRKRI